MWKLGPAEWPLDFNFLLLEGTNSKVFRYLYHNQILSISDIILSIDKNLLSKYNDAMDYGIEWVTATANRLAALYEEEFGGKTSGRYRIPAKLVRNLAQRRRLYENDIEALRRALLEIGFVLIDMDGFFVVMSANAFVNYRRANEDVLE